MYSVQCSENVIGMCTVYSAVRMLLVCVQCTVKFDCYWYVFSVQCNETLIGMCTVYRSVRLLLVLFKVYSAVRMLLVCVQCTVQ